jgi:hypothetical protein
VRRSDGGIDNHVLVASAAMALVRDGRVVHAGTGVLAAMLAI